MGVVRRRADSFNDGLDRASPRRTRVLEQGFAGRAYNGTTEPGCASTAERRADKGDPVAAREQAVKAKRRNAERGFDSAEKLALL
jgi:hypothetical protein